MQTIYLDISNRGVVPTIYAKQGDVGRKFEVVFTNSGLPYVIADESFLSVWYSGESGEGNYTEIDGHSAFTVNVNKVAIEIITQALVNDGNGVFCIVLNEPGGRQIGSWNIPYICEAIPGFESEEAESYYTAFSDSIEKLYQTTENLTPGAIGAAPAGYVDATYSVSNFDGLLSTVNTVLSTMDGRKYAQLAFSVSDWSDYIPSGEYLATVYKESNGYGLLTVKCNSVQLQNRLYNGTWEGFEWVNPPMTPGVEYRTTERWNGKAVYTKLINCGLLPAVGTTSSTGIHASREITQAIRAEGQFIFKTNVGGGDAIPYYAVDSGDIRITVTRYTAKISTVSWNGTVPGVEAYARVWYVLD